MAISKDEISEIYDSMGNKSWSGLFDEVSYRINRPEGIDDRNLYLIQEFAGKMDDEPFPTNVNELYQMVVDQLGE